MKYTAIFPTKNPEFAVRCIESLLDNSHILNDVLVINNNPDAKYPINDPRVKIVCCFDRDVYGMYNLGVELAKSENVLLLNDDMYFPTLWDKSLETLNDVKNLVLTFTVVESGYVDVNSKNIPLNFGMDWLTFKEDDFEVYANRYGGEVKPGLGWYMPVLMSKELFNDNGGYNTEPPFPFPHDVAFFGKLMSRGNIDFRICDARIYHFQRLSQRKPKDKLNLCCGEDKRDGYLNVDVANSELNIDISCGLLPFENKSFSEVLFRHAIEHFRFEEANKILLEIKRVLREGGYVDIYSPECSLSMEDYLSGSNTYQRCADPIYRVWGLNSSIEQVHKSGYTAKLTRWNNIVTILRDLGFDRTETIPTRDADEFGVRAYV